MKNITNYILFGRGVGARWLLLYSLIVAIFAGVSFKMLGNLAVPVLQNVADQLLPIKIEDGVIVEPKGVVKVVKLDAEELDQFPIVLDTTVDSVDTLGMKDGIYISRKAVYMVTGEQTKMHKFQGSMDLPKDDYTNLFKTVATYSSWGIGILALGFMFLLFLALTAFYAVFAVLLSKACKIFLNYAAAMRLSALVYIATSVLMAILRLCGLRTDLWLYFVAVIALQTIILRCMTKKDEPTKSINRI